MRFAFLGVAVVVGLLACAQPVPGQGKKVSKDTTVTEIGGKTIEQWIKELAAKDPSKKENALRTIILFPPERAYQAIPAITLELKRHTTSAPVDTSVRVNGVIALGIILGGVKETDPKIERDAILAIKRFVADPQSLVRYRAVQALGHIGPDAREVLPEVLNAMKDPTTWEVRQAAAVAVGSMALDDKNGPPVAVLNVLFKALEDNASQVRLAAIKSLTFLGSPHDGVVKFNLIKALDAVAFKDPEPTVQIWAHLAVISTTKEVHKPRVEFVGRMLRHSELATRVQACQALGTIGKDARETVPALIKTLDEDTEPLAVGWAIWALGRMERSATAALSALERIRKDAKQPEGLRLAAEESIDYITGKKKLE